MIREIDASNFFKNNIVCSTFLAAGKIPESLPESILRSHKENNVMKKIIAIWNWVSKFIYYIICTLFCLRPRGSTSSINKVSKEEIFDNFKYNQPLCHGSIKKLKQAQKINKELSFFEKIQNGVLTTPLGTFYKGIMSKGYKSSLENAVMTCANAIVWIAAIYFFHSALKYQFPPFKKFINLSICITNLRPVEMIFVAPVVEEILCRGCLNNGIFLGQKLLKKISPNCLKGRFFNYITSPSPRMLFVHGMFSYHHYFSAPVIFILCSNFTLLHETTGNIAIPIIAHMTHNIYAFALQQLVCR